MKIGFTGTQIGMTRLQASNVESLILKFTERRRGWGLEFVGEGHHGYCIGADEQFHDIATACQLYTVAYPSNIPGKHATCKVNEMRPEAPPLERNHLIVETTRVLIAAPKQASEQLRSGTWATVRYARKMARPIAIVMPSGMIIRDGAKWPQVWK